MAECKIAAGVTGASCAARFSSPGINHDDIYIFNHSEISAYTSSVTGEVSALSFQPTYEVGFKVAVHKDSGIYTETLQVSEEGAAYYEQSLSAKIIANDTDTRNAIEGFVGVDVVIAFKQKNGKYRIIGEAAGVKLSENVFDTGKVAGDGTGDTVVWTGIENGKARFFFDTSEATTKTTLDGYL